MFRLYRLADFAMIILGKRGGPVRAKEYVQRTHIEPAMFNLLLETDQLEKIILRRGIHTADTDLSSRLQKVGANYQRLSKEARPYVDESSGLGSDGMEISSSPESGSP